MNLWCETCNSRKLIIFFLRSISESVLFEFKFSPVIRSRLRRSNSIGANESGSTTKKNYQIFFMSFPASANFIYHFEIMLGPFIAGELKMSCHLNRCFALILVFSETVKTCDILVSGDSHKCIHSHTHTYVHTPLCILNSNLLCEFHRNR